MSEDKTIYMLGEDDLSFGDYIPEDYTSFDQIPEDGMKFLELSGRKAMYTQGIYGQDIIVAVLDTGVRASHEEFEGRVIQPGILTNTTIPGYAKDFTDDDNGHGTHCAASIAGKRCGIAPKARILPVKVLDGSGSAKIRNIFQGIKAAVDWVGPNGEKVDIISMSLSFMERDCNNNLDIENMKTMVKYAIAHDVTIFCSMGNTGSDANNQRYPACLPEVIAVGAVDVEKNKAYFSTTGNHCDICQVGVDVISACHTGDTNYVALNGTSMSTPISAGIGALLACKYKQLNKKKITDNELYLAVKANTKDLGIPGVDKTFGAGFFTVQALSLDLQMVNGSKTIIINGVPLEMDVPVQIIDGRTMLPVRFIGDATGAYIKFEFDTTGNNAHKIRFTW